MKIGPLLAHLEALEASYAEALRGAARQFADEQDVHHQCLTFAVATDRAAEGVGPLRHRHTGAAEWEVVRAEHGETLLETLRGLCLAAHGVAVTWAMALQAAKAARDAELAQVASRAHLEADTQAKWFLTRIKVGAPQALVVE